jgi:formiminoglutamase
MIDESTPFRWTGRDDTDEAGDTRRWHHIVHPGPSVVTEGPPATALLGFACDAGVRRNHGRPGAAEGPIALRRALTNIPVHGEERIDDLGDVTCTGDHLEHAQNEFAHRAELALRGGSMVLGLGGGHAIAWAMYQAIHAALPERSRLLVVNLDAHLDVRDAPRPTSGTPFLQILQHAEASGRRVHYHASGVSLYANTCALFERAQLLSTSRTLDEQLQRASHVDAETDRLIRLCRAHDAVYLTVCLDVLPEHVAPGVSAPSPLGVPLAHIERLMEGVLSTGRVIAADIAEFAPRYDPDGRTGRVAARLAARIARGVAGVGRNGRMCAPLATFGTSR